MILTIELTDEEATALSACNEHGDQAAAIREFIECAKEGVKRKGAWQRDAMIHIFSDFDQYLENDPDNRGLQRVKART